MADDKISIGIEADLNNLIRDVQKGDTLASEFAKDFDDDLKKINKTVDDFGKEFGDVEDALNRVENELEDVAVEAKKTGSIFDNAFAGIIAGLAAGATVAGLDLLRGGLTKLVDVGTSSVNLFQVQQKAVRQLGVAIEATGGAAGYSSEELQKHASYLQTITNVGDETTLAMFAMQSSFTNVRGENFLRTTEVAMDLAEALGGDNVDAAQKLAKALNDPIAGMSELKESGVVLTLAQQKQVEAFVKNNEVAKAQALLLDEVEARYGGSAKAAADAEGNYTQLWNRVGDVQEVFGGLIVKVLDGLAPAFEFLVVGLERGVGALDDISASVMDTADSMGFGSDALASWGQTLLEWFTIAETVVMNLGDVFDLMAKSNALSLTSTGEDFKFWFTEQLPEYISWFADHWSEVLTDFVNFHNTVYMNMWSNVVTFFTGVFDYLSGGKGSFEFKGLTEGFESSITELPKILERTKTDVEKALEADIAKAGTSLVDKYAANLQKNQALLDEFTAPSVSERPDLVDKSATVNAADIVALDETEKAAEKAVEKAVASSSSSSSSSSSKEAENPEIGQKEGLASLNERISSAASQYQNKQLDIGERQVALLENIAENGILEAPVAPNMDLSDISPVDVYTGSQKMSTDARQSNTTVVDNRPELHVLINDQRLMLQEIKTLVKKMPFNGVLT